MPSVAIHFKDSANLFIWLTVTESICPVQMINHETAKNHYEPTFLSLFFFFFIKIVHICTKEPRKGILKMVQFFQAILLH